MISYDPLKSHMGINRISIESLSEATGVHRNVIAGIVNSKTVGSIGTIEKISLALKLPIEQIVTIKEE